MWIEVGWCGVGGVEWGGWCGVGLGSVEWNWVVWRGVGKN